ncbi:hypothetical protein BC939DRAFT_470668 [Gamsiella multidivaricata]|uniref:uncharacterized protein n=1 Tax=Gamsiella multidivaricata TaxID=101098 RepID=UPI00221FDDCE|nr:uncharacterized protein BC939DRAFT_470668 [Gamsiella multidivaricata]KAI7816024.1 hypothetical protein BC939DRAFT_470668 [Gamsiella multidivaricata]
MDRPFHPSRLSFLFCSLSRILQLYPTHRHQSGRQQGMEEGYNPYCLLYHDTLLGRVNWSRMRWINELWLSMGQVHPYTFIYQWAP